MPTPKSMTMLSYGAAGPAVKLLQEYLNLLPSQLLQRVEDGAFGGKTKALVQEFQGANALAPDAVVGPLTWDAILAALGGPNQWLLRFRIIQTAVGYVDQPFQHHFIVRVWPEGGGVKVDTIEGNSGPSSNFSFKRRDLKVVNAWYSVF